jgi:hypothetical protein
LTACPLEKQEETQTTPVILWEDLGTAVAWQEADRFIGLEIDFNAD